MRLLIKHVVAELEQWHNGYWIRKGNDSGLDA